MSTGRQRVAASLGLAGLLVVLAGCGAQTPSPAAYQDRSEKAVSDALTSVATVRLVVERLTEQGMLGAYADIALTDAAESIDKSAASYASLDPPPSRQRMFDTVSAQLGKAADLVIQTRIAVSRDDTGSYPRLERMLGDLTTLLDTLDGSLQ